MGLTINELVKKMKRSDLEALCMCLLYKRESDGLNKRTWDASRHLKWEGRLSIILKKYDYLGNINHDAINA